MCPTSGYLDVKVGFNTRSCIQVDTLNLSSCIDDEKNDKEHDKQAIMASQHRKLNREQKDVKRQPTLAIGRTGTLNFFWKVWRSSRLKY
jgi:hypothetical protein